MKFAHPISIAPMMDRTDRHYRFLMRQLTRRTLLYTEMVTANAILFGDVRQHLRFHPDEHPISLQLGGDDPTSMARAAVIGVEYGYDEININVGCPSDRVKSGNFGACLMKTPEHVAELVRTMRAAVDVPVTVKHRIGVDDLDSYDDMKRFVEVVAAAGCTRFSVHARKAWLQGLSPKENREIPPLRYDDVYRLKRELPELIIEINGGIRTLEESQAHLEHVDAVMIGRAAYDTPLIFSKVDEIFFNDPFQFEMENLITTMVEYAREELAAGTRLAAITRHMLHLFSGKPGARIWRRHLSENSWREEQTADLIAQAYELMLGEFVRHSA